jgi:hypothetical protein
MWIVMIFLFFNRFTKGFHQAQTDSYKAKDDTLTFEQVQEKFEQSPPVEEPQR